MYWDFVLKKAGVKKRGILSLSERCNPDISSPYPLQSVCVSGKLFSPNAEISPGDIDVGLDTQI